MLKEISKKLLLSFIKKDSTVYKWFETKYRHGFLAPPNTNSITDIITHYCSKKKDKIFFVQIGANNGVSNDPLNKFILADGWSGLLVEPLPDVFEVLKKNYLGTRANLLFENAAIGSINGEVPFYYVENSEYRLPEWTSQLSSFNKDVVVKNLSGHPHLIQLIKCVNIKTLTFSSLIEKYKIQKIDLLHSDTEGFDYQILKTINFSEIHPDIILFESIHLSRSDFAKTVRLLKKADYEVFVCGSDSIAIDKQFSSLIMLASN